ncbi:hypothetical protein M407DRAFT_246463 [Tulasnella calospora MUT 4182]|uniref:Protein kinase domain-containing protein n=1 Tax=Tulasnella calospora MUT 4182 TaxID=1051891 RepID=A0A0C3Q519_9AGAM|nr:hypothetical protein M407DRAFT_246463 [Tulasnella calospora MUT 4182]
MDTFAAELLESVTDLDDRNGSSQDIQNGDGHESKLKRSSARVRLDRLSNLRIHTDDINFTSSEPHGSGGKAEVVKATMKRGDGSGKREVAVKMLRYYDDMNDRKFGNVRTMVFKVFCWSAKLAHVGIRP